MLASADISIRWRYPPLALAFTGVSLRSLSRPPFCSIHHLGLFTPPSNITPSPNRRRYFSEFPNPPPPSLLSTFPPSLPGNFAAGSCCSGSACGQGLVLPSRTHAPLPPPPPTPNTTTTSTLTLRPSPPPPLFPPLYPCLTFTVFISPFSGSPFSFLSFSASVSLSPNPACQAWLHGC